MVFDIFSKRKKFEYNLKERFVLYLGFLGPVLRFLRCRCLNYDHMIHMNKIFQKAKKRLDHDCDIIEVMDQVRKSKNFQRNYLSRQQKILLKFDHSNIIDGNSESEVSGGDKEDHDDIIAKNLNSPNGLVVIFTIAKLMSILKPYIEVEQLSHFDKNLFHSFYSSKFLQEKPKKNLLGAITSFLKKKIAPAVAAQTNFSLLEDVSALDPMPKGESAEFEKRAVK
jgi:hypothetical protein